LFVCLFVTFFSCLFHRWLAAMAEPLYPRRAVGLQQQPRRCWLFDQRALRDSVARADGITAGVGVCDFGCD
jgi:hypothetical protein